MIREESYVRLASRESVGGHGSLGIRITVAGSNMPDLEQDEIWSAADKAINLIESAINVARIAKDPDAQEFARRQRDDIIGLFNGPIYIEAIPNGYCDRYCCKHLPWFIVTTPVGRIKIGWRKRVISIDWTDTRGTKTADELFSSEDVTKEHRLIHAWDISKAREYIAKICNP